MSELKLRPPKRQKQKRIPHVCSVPHKRPGCKGRSGQGEGEEKRKARSLKTAATGGRWDAARPGLKPRVYSPGSTDFYGGFLSELKLRPPKRIMRKREERARGSVWAAKSANDGRGGGGKKRGESPQSEDCGYRSGTKRKSGGKKARKSPQSKDCGYRGTMGRGAPWAKAQGLRPRVYSPGSTGQGLQIILADFCRS